MTKEMLDTLVNALSAPSWVDILLLIITTAYFVATVFVYLANKKMAKAAEDQIKAATQMAELSRNIDMYDKRFALIKNLVTTSFWDICVRREFLIELKLLFPSEGVQGCLAEFMNSYREAKDVDDDYDSYVRNSFLLTINVDHLQQQIENALKEHDERDEIERTRDLAEQHIVTVQENGATRRLNLFEILELRMIKEVEVNNNKERLIDEMITDIEQTVSTDNN